MTTEKLKGIVRDRTLQKILDDKDTSGQKYVGGDLRYDTIKSTFIARRKNGKYWNIFQVFGA
jgi:hypothetical protein